MDKDYKELIDLIGNLHTLQKEAAEQIQFYREMWDNDEEK